MSSDPIEKTRAWLRPNIADKPLTPGLYLVATPIGNLRDITIRALDTLAKADLILCEDTRVTGKLLHAYEIKGKLEAYNDHNAARVRPKIIEHIKDGGRVALVSDAGLPLISDPGWKLVQDIQEHGLYVTTLPGANAALSALQLSGLPSDQFCFIGFLPAKTKARCDVLRDWANVKAPLITYETAPRLQPALADILATLGTREVVVAREISKLYEEVRRGNVEELLTHYEEHGPPKGEIVLVIAGAKDQLWTEETLAALLGDLLKDHPVKEAARLAADQSGLPRKKLYEMALGLRDG